jgi:Ala-tRNA(Pro) deacylase
MNAISPLTPEQLYRMLDDQGIDYELAHHKPLMTVEDARSIRSGADTDEGQIKNLFLKNRKGAMWLLTLHENRAIDLKQTASALGAKRFSFCSADRLMQYLGVTAGAVSPLALLNDTNAEVSFYVDEALLGDRAIHVHPLHNQATVSLDVSDMLEFLAGHGHDFRVLPLDLTDLCAV